MCLLPLCASSTRAVWLQVDAYVPQLQSGRGFRIRLAALVRTVGPMAKKLCDTTLVVHFTYAGAAAYVHMRLVCAVVQACLNVDARASPAVGSCLGMAAMRTVGLSLRGGRARLR